jgi:hypothetical protein
MSGKITKISLPSTATPDERRRAENFRSRMYTAVNRNNQERLNLVHDEAEAFINGIAGASIGPRVILAAVPDTPQLPAPAPAPVLALALEQVELLDLHAPAERAVADPRIDLNAAIKRAELRLSAATALLSLGDTVPSAVRDWAVQQVTHV